jgi:uncharacterized membrane protein (UPF0127 family)
MRMSQRAGAGFIVAALAFAAGPAGAAAQAPASPGTCVTAQTAAATPVRVRTPAEVLDLRVADTPSKREYGLMCVRVLPPRTGMIFVFSDGDNFRDFWMKNTLIPLDVAFIAADGVIVNIDQMKAQTLDSHCSEKPVPYVLEMNDGWFAKRGIRAGQRVRGLPALPQ